MTRDTAETHLRRLGVNPITVARLKGYADIDETTLADLVRFILSDYVPEYLATSDENGGNVVRLPESGSGTSGE